MVYYMNMLKTIEYCRRYKNLICSPSTASIHHRSPIPRASGGLATTFEKEFFFLSPPLLLPFFFLLLPSFPFSPLLYINCWSGMLTTDLDLRSTFSYFMADYMTGINHLSLQGYVLKIYFTACNMLIQHLKPTRC